MALTAPGFWSAGIGYENHRISLFSRLLRPANPFLFNMIVAVFFINFVPGS